MVIHEARSRVRSRRIQFSLRALFLLCFVFALLCLGWTVYLQPYYQEQQALAHFQALDATVETSSQAIGPSWLQKLAHGKYAQRVTRLSVGSDQLQDHDLRRLRLFRHLKDLGIVECPRVTDDGLGDVASIATLQFLTLHGTSVSGNGLRRLGSLPHLSMLQLYSDRLVDDDLAGLECLHQLEGLGLHSKGITDEGLHHIRSLSHLVYLELTCPAVTDDGLSHVADLAKLETLFLRCSVTDRGMRHLAPLTNLNFLECESRAQNSSALSWLRDEDRFDFVQMPLADVIKALESRTGLSIRLDSERLGNTGIDASDITVSAQYDKVSLRKFLDSILHPHGLNFLVQTDGLVITTIADAPPAEREIDRLKSTLPNLTRVYVSW